MCAEGRHKPFPGDGEGQHDAEQVQGSVDAHALQAALPVEQQGDSVAGLRCGLALEWHMDDAALVLGVVYRGADGDLAAVGEADPPGIAWLAAAGGVKHRAIENDAAALVQRLYLGRGLGEVGVLAEEQFCRHRSWP